jgi:hypothetical protein
MQGSGHQPSTAIDQQVQGGKSYISALQPRRNPVDITLQALCGVYVNLFDLIDHLDDPNPNKDHLIPFNTKAELRAYSEQEDKIYPKKYAKEKGIVKNVLRHLFSRGH